MAKFKRIRLVYEERNYWRETKSRIWKNWERFEHTPCSRVKPKGKLLVITAPKTLYRLQVARYNKYMTCLNQVQQIHDLFEPGTTNRQSSNGDNTVVVPGEVGILKCCQKNFTWPTMRRNDALCVEFDEKQWHVLWMTNSKMINLIFVFHSQADPSCTVQVG
jgi:hypothetical protein